VRHVDIVVRPGSSLHGAVAVPGDKSIAHRWLILAATAQGKSRLVGLPPSLDVRSTASCLASLTLKARPALDVAARDAPYDLEGGGSTWNEEVEVPSIAPVEVKAEGRARLTEAEGDLDCGNSGTSMRLLAGVVASAPFRTVLTGDESLSTRPMERVAEPLRAMGARVETSHGHPPITITGGALRGIRFESPVPTAQVKSAVLLAGLGAEGVTTVVERAQTRDHTERALEALGAPIERDGSAVHVQRFQHGGFHGKVPGDPSSAAFLIAGAALTGRQLTVIGVGLNPTRLHFLSVMERMGIQTRVSVERTEMGEPVGSIDVAPCDAIGSVRVEARELPLIIDEVPVLAALAAHATSDSWFLEAAELRVKESDRLGGIARGIRALGGTAADEGSDLVIAGGGLTGGRVDAGGDHRIAMALTIAALRAEGPSRIDDLGSADVSFPRFVETMARLGAHLEVA
jgi:3-phosphoshikimate 1-carboxyvinyltransferase